MSAAFCAPFSPSADWSSAPSLPLTPCVWSPHAPPEVQVQALWQTDALLVRLLSAAPPARAVVTQDDGRVWEDSCLEFFFADEGSGRYVNLEANANGALLAAVGKSRHERQLLASLPLVRPAVRCAPCGAGWEAVFRIPAAALRTLFGLTLQPGLTLRVNAYACGDQTPSPYYAALFPVQTESPDFHRPEFFGQLLLET